MNKLVADNRMGWCRNIDHLINNETSSYIGEYEIASDSRIPGVLDYRNGKILCGPLTLNMNSRWLYKYLLKIKFASQTDFYPKLGSKKGYAFREGIIGELISIFSLYFQCRFFLLAAYSGDLTPTGIKIKTEYTPSFQFCRPYFDPEFYPDGKRNFAIGISGFLDQLYELEVKYHQQIALACFHYARALREFGIDDEMVFIRLVSAVETVLEWTKLDKKDDLFSGKSFDEIVKLDLLSDVEKDELRLLFDNRRIKQKFKRFIEKYSSGFFKGGNFKAPHTRVRKTELLKTLDAIYNSRSNYLHNGEAMFLSRPMRGGEKWDTDIAFEMIHDNKRFTRKMKLPYSSFFQRLVRYCLMAFIKDVADS
jgi:hypothetical protein